MCNAWNHSAGCNCGWGGAYYGVGGGIRTSLISRLSDSIKKSIPKPTREPQTRLIKCWWCNAEVFYHTNGYGDSVLFDSLGYPWQIHSCWTIYCSKDTTYGNFREFHQDEQKYYILAGAIQVVRSQKLYVKEEDIASCLGLTVKLFKKYYSAFYEIYLEDEVIQFRLKQCL